MHFILCWLFLAVTNTFTMTKMPEIKYNQNKYRYTINFIVRKYLKTVKLTTDKAIFLFKI